MNTLKIKIIGFFIVTTLAIFSTLAFLLLRFERKDRIEDMTSVLYHLAAEIVANHLDTKHPHKDLDYLQGLDHVMSLAADKAISDPKFMMTQNYPPVLNLNERIYVVTKLPNGSYFTISSHTKLIDKEINHMAFVLYLTFFLAISLLSTIFYMIVKKQLEPIEQLSTLCQNIDFQNIEHSPLPEVEGSVEITNLKNGLEILIANVIALRRKERQMFQAAAHHLKTPLAILKARLDQYATDEQGSKALFISQANNDIAKLLKYLKEILLTQQSTIDPDDSAETFELCDFVQMLVNYAQPLLQRKNQSIQFVTQQNFMISTHQKAFKKLILTIIENCINHAPFGSIITISSKTSQRTLIFENLIASNDSPTLFNSDLGLSIIRAIGERLSLEIRVHHDEKSFYLTIHFP